MKENEFPLETYSDRIIVKRVNLSAKTASGLILGEIEGNAEAGYGVVKAIGEGKLSDDGIFKPMKTQLEDLIAFRHNLPIRINYKGEDYWMLRETDVYYRVKDKDLEITPYQTEGTDYKQLSQQMK